MDTNQRRDEIDLGVGSRPERMGLVSTPQGGGGMCCGCQQFKAVILRNGRCLSCITSAPNPGGLPGLPPRNR